MEIERSLDDWQQSVIDTGLEVDEETDARIEACRRQFIEIFPVLMTSFGPMNRKRLWPPVLAFFDADDKTKMRVYGAMKGATAEGFFTLANKMQLGGGWIAYNWFFADVVGVMLENGRIAKIGEWSRKLGVDENEFMRAAMIEETTHACLLKYPLVCVRPVNEDPETYAGLIERVANILGQKEVVLDPGEFWVAFGTALLEPGLRKLNDNLVKGLLTYLADIESGKKEPDKYWLTYAAEHLTTRAAFDLIGDGDARIVLTENPTILTEPNKLVENFVLPIKVRRTGIMG